MATPRDFELVSKMPLVGGDVFESSVAAIVEEPAGFAAVGFGRAVGFMLSVEAAEDVVLGRPLHIIADEKIEQAVAIVIEPERRSAEAVAAAEPAGLPVTSTKVPLPVLRKRRFWPTQVTKISGKPSLL